MSNVASSGRKKPRTKENKPPVARVQPQSGTSAYPPVSTIPVDDAAASALTDAPYSCTGRFGVDFVQLCRRAHLMYIPNVVPRPHRPTIAPVVEDKKAAAPAKPTSRVRSSVLMTAYVVSDPLLAADFADGIVPEPPPKTYTLRDPISFFRPSVQVSPYSCYTK